MVGLQDVIALGSVEQTDLVNLQHKNKSRATMQLKTTVKNTHNRSTGV